MKSNLLIITALITMMACNKKTEESPYSNFIPNGKGFVRFHSSNYTDTVSYLLYYETQLPVRMYREIFSVYSDTIIQFEINASNPIVVNFSNNESFINFMALPNDTLDIYLEPKKDKPLLNWITYKGATAEISTYLTRDKIIFYRNSPIENETPGDYNKRIDSLKSLAINALNEFNVNTKLPDWFMKYEESNIFFSSEFLKNLQFNQRYGKTHQFIKREQKENEVLDEFLIKNEWMSDEFFRCLSQLRPDKYDSLLQPQHASADIFIQYTQDNINIVKEKLTPKMLSYFIVTKISILLMEDKLYNLSEKELKTYSMKVEKLFNANKMSISDTAILNFIDEYINIRLNRIVTKANKLKNGGKAPVFYLEDIQKNKVNLGDFKGKLVCLNFWGTTCGPCIKSIPKKNEMIKKYGSKNFVLLNICLDNNTEAWKKIIQTREFKGVHLQCPGNWAEILTEKYAVTFIPHYTLIDKKGNIIMDDINRDSLEYYVEANL